MYRLIRHLSIGLGIAWLGLCVGPLPAQSQEETPKGEPVADVLSQGPIHEAFTESMSYDPEPGICVPKAPPRAIKEVPPKERPVGNVVWIPGYWGWDDDREDFIWVSGAWRVVPPGRQWIPGYWSPCKGGYQWISGYWADVGQTETAYLPEPPESVETGPNVRPPSPDYIWIPGCWVWVQGAYAWRPGYWARVRPGWVWVPAHYVWAPRGYIFVGGYWDYVVYRRGILFAPVFFGVGITLGPDFCFVPSFVIDLRIFSDCLFWRPRYHHYYFGDYYAPRHYHRGTFPWFSPHARRYGYHTIFAYQQWEHRHDPHWERNLEKTYQHRRNVEGARPPRTLHDPTRANQKPLVSKASAFGLLGATGSGREKGRMPRLKPVGREERTRMEQQGKELQQFTRERLRVESQGPGLSPGAPKEIDPHKATLPKSPIASGPSGGQGGQGKTGRAGSAVRMTPPKHPPAPKPNPTVEPLQRRVPTPPDTPEVRWHRPGNPSQATGGPPKSYNQDPGRVGPTDRPGMSRPSPPSPPAHGSPVKGGERQGGQGMGHGGNRPPSPQR